MNNNKNDNPFAGDDDPKPVLNQTSELSEARLEAKRMRMENLPDADPGKTDTAILKPSQRKFASQSIPNETMIFGEKREIILVIRGVVERVVLQEGQKVVLGRSDLRTRSSPDVDLTPYGALDRGVSREHASLHIEGEKLYVTDLNSTNGTILGGNRLEPFTSTVLRKGDELLLGRLPVQVLFR